jgi:hypothetical protein
MSEKIQLNRIDKNPITDLVLDNIQSFEELNAQSLKEGETAFAETLIKILEKREVEGTLLGMGSQSLVQRLKEAQGVVIKRLMFGRVLKGQGNLSPGEYFNHKKEEYALVRKYFGPEFTPHTEFVEVNSNFNSPHPDTILGYEYIMVQEELSGVDASFQAGSEWDFKDKKLTEALKGRVWDFISRYQHMQTESGRVIEDQIRVDFNKGELYIQDTDFLPSYKSFTQNNAFLEYIEAEGQTDIHSIIILLGVNVPALSELNGISDTDLNEVIPLAETKEFSSAQQWLLRKLRQESKNIDELQAILFGFSRLVTAIDYFPPTGDNFFIKRLKRAFDLESLVN